MLKRIARFVLRRELEHLRATTTYQQTLLSQWKTAAKAWEGYAKQFVPASAPPFHAWFMSTWPKPTREMLS